MPGTEGAKRPKKPCVKKLDNCWKEEVDNLVALGAIHFPR